MRAVSSSRPRHIHSAREPAPIRPVPVQTSSTNPLTGQPYEQLGLRSGDLSLLLGAAGFKFNAGTNLLLNANVLFPLTDAGLRDRLTFAFGIRLRVLNQRITDDGPGVSSLLNENSWVRSYCWLLPTLGWKKWLSRQTAVAEFKSGARVIFWTTISSR